MHPPTPAELWEAYALLTTAQASVAEALAVDVKEDTEGEDVMVDVTKPDEVVAAPMQEQALERRKYRSPFWFALQLFDAKVGIAVADTVAVSVKVAQNDCAAPRRPGVWVALKARRQLSAAQSAAATSAMPASRAGTARRLLRIFILDGGTR
jgi:hypothetical protein